MNARSKTLDLDALALKTAELRQQGKRIVHCHGVFDLLHLGHIRYFEAAKRYGDVLVVTLTPDEYVNKGPHRPIFTGLHRAEAIAALACVDAVAINTFATAVETIGKLRPNFYVKGSEYRNAGDDITGGITREREAVEAVGGQLVFTDDITFSSSNLLNRALPVFSKETHEYLRDLGTRHPAGRVQSYLKNAQSLRVLVVGETIIDEYVFCETLGKAGKEPVLAARQLKSERFAGGVIAIANHLASFAGSVSVLSFIGSDGDSREFIQSKLAANVQPALLPMESAPTILKRRFVELDHMQKLFETYVLDDEPSPRDASLLLSTLAEMLPRFDLVIVADYGHGMLSEAAVGLLTRGAKFLAVNVQVNAHNHGFNTMGKYPRADYVSISERELRLDARSRKTGVEELIERLSARLSASRVMITRGEQGCVCYSKTDGFFRSPALAMKVVDRIGAGDALFAVSSLCVAQGMPMEVVGFVANAAGAQAVATVGNREPVGQVSLMKFIESLLK